MILVIWCEMLEEVNFVVLTSDKLKIVEQFHNHFINEGDTDLDTVMLKFFYNDGDFKFTKTKEIIRDQTFEAIIVTGFIL